MNILYVCLSYVVIGFVMFLGLRHIDSLNDNLALKEQEIQTVKESRDLMVKAYDEEIAELTKTAKQRKITVKEIVRVAKGSEDEKCLNTVISNDVLERLQKHGKRN